MGIVYRFTLVWNGVFSDDDAMSSLLGAEVSAARAAVSQPFCSSTAPLSSQEMQLGEYLCNRLAADNFAVVSCVPVW